MNPTVSIITTIYNAEEFVAEALQSIVNQEYKDLEICVILDGCTDNSYKIVDDSLKNSGIDYFISVGKENKGIPIRRMQAIQRSRGAFLAIQDADDISFLNRIGKEADYLKKHPEVFCVGSWAVTIDEQGKELRIADIPSNSSRSSFNGSEM